jgi:cysteinyl-tRNA synthetase
MKVFNTETRMKEELVPIEEGKIRMYACGPTVYNFFHVGNARCFVVFDMLRRYLRYRGYEVTFVQNFTDIDDKMIKKANEEGTTVKAVADRYIEEYFKDAKGLGIEPATFHPHATDNIEGIVDIITKLMDKGHAYRTGDGVYFRTRSYRDYGKLSHMNKDDLESGARIEVDDGKEDPLDFALWKAKKPGEPFWASPFGEGRPGWHIECSAMSRRYLGESIDIHCGGQDLTFPHHENEIAQSECCSGKQFVKYWMHNGYINVDNQKMSKSLGNFFTVRDAAAKFGYLPIRFFLLSAHYRTPVNFSADTLAAAKSSLERIFNARESLEFYVKNAPAGEVSADVTAKLAAHKDKFITVMDDDFNTADGTATIFELVSDVFAWVKDGVSKGSAEAALALLDELCTLMGHVKETNNDDDLVKYIEEQIALRVEAKKAKNFAEADRIRNELAEKGIILKDTREGTTYTINA